MFQKINKERMLQSATMVSIIYFVLGISLYSVNYNYYHIFIWNAIFGLVFTIVISFVINGNTKSEHQL